MAHDKGTISNQLLADLDDLEQRIAELETAERILLKREEDLNLILDAIPAMVFYKDRENRFLRVNDALANEVGLPREAIEGRTAFELFPEQAEAYWRDDKEVMSAGLPKLNIVQPVETPQGRRWLRTDKIPLHDANGQVMGVVGLATDITDLLQTEEATRQSREMMRAVLDSVADGVLAVDVNKQVCFANKRFAQMWRIPPDLMETGDDDELLRYVLDQLVAPDEFLAKVRELYQSFRDDFDIIRFRDGRIFERSSRAFVIGDALGGRVWCFHDITQPVETTEA